MSNLCHSNKHVPTMRRVASWLLSVWRFNRYFAASILAGVVLVSGSALAARVSDITHTKHNLSVNGPGDVKAYNPYLLPNPNPRAKQNQICVFCHTPHGATMGMSASGVNSEGGALWNRKLSAAKYTTYSSTSLAADDILKADPAYSGYSADQINLLKQPGGSSKLCLSCHDGTLAIGNVNVMWGLGTSDSQWQQIMLGTENYDPNTVLGGKMPFGGYGGANSGVSGVATGYTRNLGGVPDPITQRLDLTNDHPISVSYTQALAALDGELRDVEYGTQRSLALPVGVYGVGDIIGKRGRQYRPMAPLEPTGPGGVGQVQCAACHDPHIRDTDPTVGNQKFLRLNRFQEDTQGAGARSAFNFVTDIGCKACHDKNFSSTPLGDLDGVGNSTRTSAGTWDYSAHANPQVVSGSNNNGAPYTYTTAKGLQNEFPTIADRGAKGDFPMWQASCLNCHDTHTVQGARWLLREGTDSTSVPKAGGGSAIEETCYQCHSSSSALNSNTNVGGPVADIKSDFALNFRMPITLSDQQGLATINGAFPPAVEVHSIGGGFPSGGTPSESVDCSFANNPTNRCGADFVETRVRLGAGTGANPNPNLANRHAECTDCHNPHRAVKFQNFLGNPAGTLSGPPDAKGTHLHTDTSTSMIHTNVASGSLRGTFGVEPTYSTRDFNAVPSGQISYAVKRGDPTDYFTTDCASYPTSSHKTTCDGKAYVTREYQICLKCHSDYGYDDDNNQDGAGTNRPKLGGTGLTPATTNGLMNYTNQAREFQAPSAAPTHQGEPVTTSDGGANSTYYSSNNHRSWHPVMDSTGRTGTSRGNGTDISNAWLPPWNSVVAGTGAVGTQTMYCSDCHGTAVGSSTSVIPDAGGAGSTSANWGPHGSTNPFILKGTWNNAVGDSTLGGSGTSYLCFKCHSYNRYALGEAAATAAPDMVGGSTGVGVVKRTGFWTTDNGGHDGHQLHVDRISASNSGKATRCDWCHAAVPHGFKNKGLLVNLNDIGPEAGGAYSSGTEVQILAASGVTAFNAAPYYMNARLKVLTFAPSGNWSAADCGSRGTGVGTGTGNGAVGLAWMSASGVSPSENCATPP